MSETPINLTKNNEEKLYKFTCDGFGCSLNASKEIAVSAGKFGIFTLNLCSKCAELFE